MTTIIKLVYELFANTETIQDPSTPCTSASINNSFKSTPAYAKQKDDLGTKPHNTHDRNYVETEHFLPTCDPSILTRLMQS